MSQTTATKLVSKLRFKLHDRRKLRNVDGPQGRHGKIKKTLTALLKHERIEMNYHRADETRGYAERLISEAIRNGDLHKPTMELASYWIIEPQIVHKLFKVLAPRYTSFDLSYTKLWRAPNIYPGHGRPKCVLELRNNIYPSLEPDRSFNKNLIHNVLLEEAKKVYRKNKAEMATKNVEMENKTILESEEYLSKTKGNIQGEPGVDVSAEARTTVGDSELQEAENVKADSLSKSESQIKSKVDSSSLEVDLDKMKIAEEKPKETK